MVPPILASISFQCLIPPFHSTDSRQPVLHCTSIWSEAWKYYLWVMKFKDVNNEHAYVHTYVHNVQIWKPGQWWRWLGLLFHTAFSWPCKTLRSQYLWGALIGQHGLRASPRHWLHLVLWFVTGVVACFLYGWSWGCLWVSLLTGSLLSPPSPLTSPHISVTPDITAMIVKVSKSSRANYQ